MTKIKGIYDSYWQNRLTSVNNDPIDDHSPNEIFETIASLMKTGWKLLDVGCGEGKIAEIARTKFDEIYGCDISKTALLKAKDRGISTVCVDLNDGLVPYKDNSFDCITALEVAEHLVDPLRFFNDLRRILKPKGQLLLTTPNIRYLRNLYRLIFKGIFPHTTTDDFIWGGGHIHYFTRKDITYLLNEAGFKKTSFHINGNQFPRSWKRRIIRMLVGPSCFSEFFCGGICVEVIKE
ncbi:MAG TPA: class I SAM-dependent methyltransferase [Syntrophales bacterium]|nr:class I SAM-dependent methyltransferase [Syntrophales bacterium]